MHATADLLPEPCEACGAGAGIVETEDHALLCGACAEDLIPFTPAPDTGDERWAALNAAFAEWLDREGLL